MKKFNNILCVVDPDKSSDTAIIQATRVAKDHQANITFLSVIKEPKSRLLALRSKGEHANDFDELLEQKRTEIENKISNIDPSLKSDVAVFSGIGFIEIIKTVLNNNYDLVVKCAEDCDWLSRLFGSEDMHLLRKCPCSVLMLKPGQESIFQNILAAVDVSDAPIEGDKQRVQGPLNRQVLEYSALLSMPELTTLHIGSAWEAYGEDFYRYGAFSQLPDEKVDQYVEQIRLECSDKLQTLIREMGEMLGEKTLQYLQPRVHLVKGNPSREIPLLTEQENIDLIVMGTVGRIGIPGLIIGNTAESILDQVKCSVLAIKPEGFKTPVI